MDVLELSPLPKQMVPLILCQNTFDHISNNTRWNGLGCVQEIFKQFYLQGVFSHHVPTWDLQKVSLTQAGLDVLLQQVGNEVRTIFFGSMPCAQIFFNIQERA